MEDPGGISSSNSDIAVWTTNKNVHAVYNTGKDKRQQKAMAKVFGERAARVEPEKLAVMQYFRKGTPMFGKKAEGGPILGWHDCPVVLGCGEDYYRYYQKDALDEDVNVTWITPELMDSLNAQFAQTRAARDPADKTPVVIGVHATSDRFKY
tara:strand:- start:329 stop:784 length:456 start_codon:yes stop_codon:yes gene_type:complete